MYCLLKTADRGVRASLATYLVYHTALKKASIVKPFCVTLVQLRREQAPQAGNRNLLFFCRQGRVARLKPDPSGSQPDRERQNFLHFFYFFISHEQSSTDCSNRLRTFWYRLYAFCTFNVLCRKAGEVPFSGRSSSRSGRIYAVW